MFEKASSNEQKEQKVLRKVRAENTPMLAEFYDVCMSKNEIGLALCLQDELIARGETAQLLKTLNFAIAANEMEAFTARRLAESLKKSDDPTIKRVQATLMVIAGRKDKQ